MAESTALRAFVGARRGARVLAWASGLAETAQDSGRSGNPRVGVR
jgi:hypothetical protein